MVTFTATFKNGAVGAFSVSRIAYGLPNSLGFEVFCEGGAAVFDLARAAEFTIADGSPGAGQRGPRVLVGLPTLTSHGLPMDFPSVGHGQTTCSCSEARAFLEQIAGLDRHHRYRLSPMYNMRLLEAVVTAANADGKNVPVQ